MKIAAAVWAILLSFSVTGFALLSLVIIFKGYGELREIFRKLGKEEEAEKKSTGKEERQ